MFLRIKSVLLKFLLFILFIIPVYLYRDYFLELEVMSGRESMRVSNTVGREDLYLNSLTARLSRLDLNKIFWENRLNTKIPDTYTLAVSLFDSTLWMDFNGITIHESSILAYQISDSLQTKSMSTEIESWLTKPFHLVEEWASIPKEPIRTKDISKDNNNLDSLDFRPIFTDSTVVYVVLIYSNNLRIGFKQREDSAPSEVLLKKQRISEERHDAADSSGINQESYTNLLYGDWLSIELAPLDIIAIYRALQSDSQVIIGL